MPYYAYMLKCSDGSYYTSSTSNLALRLAEHQAGIPEKSYTSSRLPVELVWSSEFATHDEAFWAEHQIKGWSRSKKEALIRGDWDGIRRAIQQQKDKRSMQNKKIQAP